ncbi:MAG: SURF1 family protein [Sphingobium sp.]
MNPRRRRSAAFLVVGTLTALALFAGLTALGLWQVQRIHWKHALVAQIESRVGAAPVPAPKMANEGDAYRRVIAQGRFLHDRAVLVQASTARGAGYWVMTPLAADGFTLLVNRGFVPPEQKARYDRLQGVVRVTGLIRMSEPGGGFLRANDAAQSRWYSRDVAAIAQAQRLKGLIAPYFIDAEGSGGYSFPIGGLTVLTFSDNHLGYAITWFVLAAMVAAAYIRVMIEERRARRT